jgi:hypothetical protein
MPETSERDARELKILTAMVAPLGWAEGYFSENMSNVQQRALELAGRLGTEPAPPLLRGLALAALCRDDFQTARDVGRKLQERGERENHEVLLVEAEYVPRDRGFLEW